MALFASGKIALGECDVCGFRFKLKELKALTIKQKRTNIMACPQCWTPDQPQLMLGTFKIEDPQALRNPRSDSNQLEASRDIQWGWNPVGGSRAYADDLTPNPLVATGEVGTVLVATT